jgi:purine nucleoside phosphorylase
MVTDHDVGLEGTEPVSAETVARVFEENNQRLRKLLFAVITRIAPPVEHLCTTALRDARI